MDNLPLNITRWQFLKALGRGGQGETCLVKSEEFDVEKAVLKLLRNQDSEQARIRINREVASQKLMRSKGASVPKIIDDNVNEYETFDVPLYFVMEFVEGSTLDNLVAENGPCSIDDGVTLALSLLDTVGIGIDTGVIHRDLKPENMIVSESFETVYVLDYGVSYSSANPEQETVTKTGERIDNSFLTLPERIIEGADRRDFRSDLTSVSAILFFVITGKYPVALIDHEEKSPHRRYHQLLEKAVGSSAALSDWNLYFDRAFKANMQMRFQSPEELRARLKALLSTATDDKVLSPLEYAKLSAQRFAERDRTTQVQQLKSTAQPIQAAFAKAWGQYNKKINPFQIESAGFSTKEQKDDLLEDMSLAAGFKVYHRNYPQQDFKFGLGIFARGMEIVIATRTHDGVSGDSGWKEYLVLAGKEDVASASENIKHLVDREITLGMQYVERKILDK